MRAVILLLACSWGTPAPTTAPEPASARPAVIDRRPAIDALVAALNTRDTAAAEALTTGEAAKTAQQTADFRVAFPDGTFTVGDVVQEGDRAAVRVAFSGTHDGPLMGIPASHKVVKFDMTWWLDFAPDGRVARWVSDGDVFAMFAQIGTFPTMPMK